MTGYEADEIVGHPLSLLESGVHDTAGVAVFPADGADEDALLRSAEEALYRAKAPGRNRVVASALA